VAAELAAAARMAGAAARSAARASKSTLEAARDGGRRVLFRPGTRVLTPFGFGVVRADRREAALAAGGDGADEAVEVVVEEQDTGDAVLELLEDSGGPWPQPSSPPSRWRKASATGGKVRRMSGAFAAATAAAGGDTGGRPTTVAFLQVPLLSPLSSLLSPLSSLLSPLSSLLSPLSSRLSPLARPANRPRLPAFLPVRRQRLSLHTHTGAPARLRAPFAWPCMPASPARP
jgi:hypothetical protein